MKQQHPDKYGKIMTEKISPDFEAEIRKTEMEKTKQVIVSLNFLQ